jgi:hypothetical protein
VLLELCWAGASTALGQCQAVMSSSSPGWLLLSQKGKDTYTHNGGVSHLACSLRTRQMVMVPT